MKHLDYPQYSPEWRKARLGIPTASSFAKVMMGKGTKTRQDYLCRLVMERILGRSLDENVRTKWMEYGSKTEIEAVDAFHATQNLQTIPVGFLVSNDGRYGCSPDRAVKDRLALVEIKCPAPWTHARYHIYGPGDDYTAQVQGQMLVTGFDKVYFFSYFPGLPPFKLETERDEKYIERLAKELENFCNELDQKEAYFREFKDIDLTMALQILAQLMPEVYL
jgi:hypothetical protein